MHRDLKASNVFLTRQGICKLGDFGIARVLAGTREKAMSIVGTPLYLAPEMLQQKPYNQKSDIWALGTLLYEMAALRAPWNCMDIAELGNQICTSKYPPLPEIYSWPLKNIVQMCLQKNPTQRPSINQILNMPLIQKRIKNYLQEDMFKQEFSHTLLHNQNVFDEFKKIQNRLTQPDAAQQEDIESQPTESDSINSMFHPPERFMDEGGQEDFYQHQLQELVTGVNLNDSVEVNSQLQLEPDGLDFNSSNIIQIEQSYS